ncbi:MAG: hypothetical protein KH334_07540 [Clostridiales bacterium]|nr:hypothetical protein [Clostridiales bacterium]
MITCIAIFGAAILLLAGCVAFLAAKLERMEKQEQTELELLRQRKEFQEHLAKEERQFQALMNYRGGLDEAQEI